MFKTMIARFSIIKCFLMVAMLLGAAACFQSCSEEKKADEPNETLFEGMASELTLTFGVPYNLSELTGTSELPEGTGVIITGDCVWYSDGILSPYAVGECELRIYKDSRINIIKTVRIKVVPSYDASNCINPNIGDNLTLKYNQVIPLISIPDIPEEKSISDFLREHGLSLRVKSKNGIINYLSDIGKLQPVEVGRDTVTISFDGGVTVSKSFILTVVPQFEIKMKQCEKKALEEILGEKRTGYITIVNERVLSVTNDTIEAKMPGHTIIYASAKAIGVTVAYYEGPALFQVPDIVRLSTIEEIKAEMKDYTLKSERKEVIDRIEYDVLTYAPFDQCKSISFYCSGSNGPRLYFARVDTGCSSDTVFQWLARDYEPLYLGDRFLNEFIKTIGNKFRIYIEPVDKTWSEEKKSWSVVDVSKYDISD